MFLTLRCYCGCICSGVLLLFDVTSLPCYFVVFVLFSVGVDVSLCCVCVCVVLVLSYVFNTGVFTVAYEPFNVCLIVGVCVEVALRMRLFLFALMLRSCIIYI